MPSVGAILLIMTSLGWHALQKADLFTFAIRDTVRSHEYPKASAI